MCLAVPMSIVSITSHLACREARRARRNVSLTLPTNQDVAIGDTALAHAGRPRQTIAVAMMRTSCAIQGIADRPPTLDLLDEITTVLDPASA